MELEDFQKFSIYGNSRKPRRDVNRYNTEVKVCANCFNVIKSHVAYTGLLAFRMILKTDQSQYPPGLRHRYETV